MGKSHGPGAAVPFQQRHSHFEQHRLHAVCLSLGEPFKARQVGVVHEIGLHVQLIAQSSECDAAERIVDAGIVFIRGTAVGAIEAQGVERGRIRRSIAHQVARR